MNETKFKILMYCGYFINPNLLENGIYMSERPNLYDKHETIESLIERGKMMKDINGINFISEAYFENLKKCQLVEVCLNILS